MSIGTSDGRSYDSIFDMVAGPVTPKNGDSTPSVDRDHHVPLLASALMDKSGQMSGMAVDHRANLGPEDEKLLALHEGTELPYMSDLVKSGMSSSEAYGVAHKVATAVETARSIAQWGQDGHEAYQQRTRDAAARAKEPSDRPRHPDAHTTKFGLDESEGAYRVAMAVSPEEGSELPGADAPGLMQRPFGAGGGGPGTAEPVREIPAKKAPFAMTRSLRGKSVVMPAGNENIKGLDDSRTQVELKKMRLDDVIKANPELMKYGKAMIKSQDVKNRRAQMHVVPDKPKGKSTYEQLKEMYPVKSILDPD